MLKRLMGSIGILALSACGFVHDEVLVSKYHLIAIDAQSDMMLCWSLESGSCDGGGLGGTTLFAAGFNEKYVVAAVHPDGPKTRRTVFVVVTRDLAGENVVDEFAPRGRLMDEEQFNAEKVRLQLPTFSRTFDHLR